MSDHTEYRIVVDTNGGVYKTEPTYEEAVESVAFLKKVGIAAHIEYRIVGDWIRVVGDWTEISSQ